MQNFLSKLARVGERIWGGGGYKVAKGFLGGQEASTKPGVTMSIAAVISPSLATR